MRETWLLACGLLIACGGTTPQTDSGVNPNSVQGDVEGRSFDAKDAISAPFDHTNGFSFNGTATFVEITDYASACSLAGQDLAPTDSRILDLGVAVNDANGLATAPTIPGTFTVAHHSLPFGANVAQAYYGSGCDKSVAYSGTSGNVTVTAVRPDGSLDGTFDIVISCADFSSCAGPDAHLTGTFSSAACAALNVNHIPACM